ncbi:MAG: YHS domain-containing protein [Desulfobacteraceae bacterium]|jgi:YHS domain-containing protein
METQKEGTALDPVCGMKVDAASANFTSSHKGKPYFFCADVCKKAFDKNPIKYLKPKGFVSRFIDRLAKSNEKTFGRGRPSCCD